MSSSAATAEANPSRARGWLLRTVLAIVLCLAAGLFCTASFADDVRPLPDTGNLVDFRGQDGIGMFRVTGAIGGSVYGTGIYTDDSDVPTAAVHAGVVAPGETKTLRIKILGGKASYEGSSAHGVVSQDYGAWEGSFEFIDRPESQDPGKIYPDPGNLEGFRDQIGKTLNFAVTGTTDGQIYGDGTYTDDSKLSTAAVHAGLLAPGQSGTLAVVILPGQDHYVSASRNNVDSRDYGAWTGSFRFAAQPQAPQGAIPDPGNMTQYRGRNGQVFQFEVTGNAQGTVFGDGIYTDDSYIAVAAVHAGVLRDGEEGIVSVKILPGQASYAGVTRNGIMSAQYGSWVGSYQFVSGK